MANGPTHRHRMLWPFDRPPHRISLSVQENPHGADASVAGDQKLVFTRDHDDVWVWDKVEV